MDPLPNFSQDATADVIAWKALAKQPVQNLTSEQLSLLGSGFAGVMVRSKLDGDDKQYIQATLALNEVFKEFRRRCVDLDSRLVPRSEL